VTKSQGGKTSLFGSALTHQQFISIEIDRACMERHLNRDWVHSEDGIVRFTMSEAQWAQFVASVGCGTGTQITLEHAPERGTPMRRMPGLEQDPIRDTFESEVREAAAKASEGVVAAQARLAELLKPGSKPPSKKDLEALNDMLRVAGQHLAGNMAFVQRSFTEAMEKTVASAKIEIETFVGNLAMRTGLEALRNGAPMLLEGNGPPETPED
jgi:hypothetical protein